MTAARARESTRDEFFALLPALALAAVTLAAAFCLDRLFRDRSFFGPVALAVLASHGVAWACRRRGLGPLASAAISAGALVLFLAWVVEPATTSYGLPLGGFWHAVSTDLTNAWEQFGKVVAPVAPARGFVVAASAGVWAAAFVADWAAFRLGAAFEALVPGFTLFTFAAALGEGRGRITTTALFLAAVILFLLAHAATSRSERTAWFASRVRGGPEAIVRGGAAVGLVTLVAALVVGPALPGATDPPLLDWRTRDKGDSSRVTISPLVDIRGRLVNQSQVEVFTVKSEVRAYWRLTSLDTFDGAVWGSKGSYRKASGDLKRDTRIDAQQQRGVQEFTILALDTPWLPAAYRAERYAGPTDVSFDPDSGSLLADTDTGNGLVYRVQSSLPKLTAAQLRGAPGETPKDVRSRYTALPQGFPDLVRQIAAQVTGGARTEYDKALALQNWFRTNFTYNLNVVPGHGERAILRFLSQREGYCEQFAGTFAAMARTLGIPARVAVGFTPGVLEQDGLYHVKGAQAHAWPEVFLENYGWVAFEPTPGRGAPGAQSYTGVPEQQDATGNGAAAAQPQADQTPTTQPSTANSTPNQQQRRNEDLLTETPFGSQKKPSPWPGRLLVLALVIGALVALWLGGVPAVRAVLRHRRRAGAATPSARTLVAWDEAGEALAIAGAARRPAETNAEYAHRAVSTTRVPLTLLDDLAGAATAAAFAPEGVDDDVAAQAEATSAEVQTAARTEAGPWRRLRWVVDPRTLRPPR